VKKIFLAVLAVSFLATTAFAINSTLTRDNNGVAIQGFTPNGRLTANLTAPGTIADMRDNTAGGIYSSSACKVRFMNRTTSATKAALVQSTVPANGYYVRVVNPATPFWNVSGCVGTFEKQ
jgi:hypothetical protein